MRSVTQIIIAAAVLLLTPAAALAQSGGDVHICGTLTEHRPATANTPGSITVEGEQFAIATDAKTNVSPNATVGSEVCLDGRWVMSQTVGRNLVEMTLTPQAAATATAATPAGPSQLPSTTPVAAPAVADPTLPLALAAALLVLLGIVAARQIATRSR